MTQPDLSSLIFLGALRSAAGFPLEHPLELMKVAAQAAPKQSTSEIVRSIVKESGISGFANTVMTNFPRRILREAVRWPVIGHTHSKLITKFPETFTKEGTNAKMVTGVSVAVFDSLVILPLEQLIAFRVKENKVTAHFLKYGLLMMGSAPYIAG